MNLPSLGPLHRTRQMLQTPAAEEPHEIGTDTVRVSFNQTKRPSVTGRCRCQPHEPAVLVIDDFIPKGQLSLEDAERLFKLYMNHLDHFMYGIGGRHKTLDGLRRSSRILAASPYSNARSTDYLRALSIGAYWLSDISWILSGHAIRRASEFNISGLYRRVISEGNPDALDYIRIWYILYISDRHLSTLFGRSPVIRDDLTVQGWEEFNECSATNEEDNRLASQVSLLNILHSIRDLFGPDNGEPISKVYVMQIAGFSRQLDQWLARWSSAIIHGLDKVIVALQNSMAANDRTEPSSLDANTHLFAPMAAGDSIFSDIDPSFVMDYNVTMGASHLMYLGGGPSVFDTADLSPTFF
ncbi:hypothetical protein PG994_010727 [Apiospora phragmitis]|uniref:Xylanolytic transcriptional activator regulatory domain-containing protein n=1 Tax=Apiospora phragmitis TaxID=2905665 RepID=A0ABR1TR62_9PEZI